MIGMLARNGPSIGAGTGSPPVRIIAFMRRSARPSLSRLSGCRDGTTSMSWVGSDEPCTTDANPPTMTYATPSSFKIWQIRTGSNISVPYGAPLEPAPGSQARYSPPQPSTERALEQSFVTADGSDSGQPLDCPQSVASDPCLQHTRVRSSALEIGGMAKGGHANRHLHRGTVS